MKYFTVHSLSMYLMTTTALSPESGPEPNGFMDFASTAGNRQFPPAPTKMALNEALFGLPQSSPRPSGARQSVNHDIGYSSKNRYNNAANGNSLQRGRKSPSVPSIGESFSFDKGHPQNPVFHLQSKALKDSYRPNSYTNNKDININYGNSIADKCKPTQANMSSYPSSPIHTLLAMERAGLLPSSLNGLADKAYGKDLPEKRVVGLNASSLIDLFEVPPSNPTNQIINLLTTGQNKMCHGNPYHHKDPYDVTNGKIYTNKDENNNVKFDTKTKNVPNTRFRVDQVKKSCDDGTNVLDSNLVQPSDVDPDSAVIKKALETYLADIPDRPIDYDTKDKYQNGLATNNLPRDNNNTNDKSTTTVYPTHSAEIPSRSALAVDEGVKTNPPIADLALRLVHEKEIVPICHWRAQEFGYGAHWDYLRILHKCYPEGWFIAHESNGDVIGNIFGMNLSDKISFGGLFSVKKPYRCRGIGGQLWNMRKAFVGDRNLGVNAVASRIVPNQKLGMFVSFEIVRYRGIMSDTIKQTLNSIDNNNIDGCLENEPLITSQNTGLKKVFQNLKMDHNGVPKEVCYKTYKSLIINAHSASSNRNSNSSFHEGKQQPNNSNVDDTDIYSILPRLINYDTKIHTIPRGRFIKELLTADETVTIVCLRDKTSSAESQSSYNSLYGAGPEGNPPILGYGVLRPRYQGFTIGPVYAESPEIGTSIFYSLLKLIPNGNIFDFMMTTQPTRTAKIHTNHLKSSQNNGSSINNGLATKQPISTMQMYKIIEAIGIEEFHEECTLYRMYTKAEVELPLENVYCITSSVAFCVEYVEKNPDKFF